MKFIMPKNSSSKFLMEDFIDNYISKAAHVYALIYLYAVRLSQLDKEAGVSEIALNFSILESDVINAFSFWENEGLLSFDRNNEIILFLRKTPDEKKSMSPEEFAERCLLDSSEKYIESCQKKMGRLLSQWEITVFLDMRDFVGLEPEVIFVIIDYCKTKGKTQIRYMEKMALDWKDKGITSQEAALDYINIYETEFRDIMKALGKSSLSPAKTDEKYFMKWLRVLNMPLDIVIEACDRTIEATGKPSLQYADKILENWKASGVRKLEDIVSLDLKFKEKKEAKDFKISKEASKDAKKQWKNRFVNFPQRNWDFDEMKKNERERLKKVLKKTENINKYDSDL